MQLPATQNIGTLCFSLCVHTCACVQVCICTYTCARTRVCTCAYACVHVRVCMCVCLCARGRTRMCEFNKMIMRKNKWLRKK